MRSDVSIRHATEGDLPAILDLYAETGLDDGVRLSLDQARDLFGRLAGYPRYWIFVAEGIDRRVMGTYALLIMDNIESTISRPFSRVFWMWPRSFKNLAILV